jgi:photosystem II stability/assembly factor-like uncharacterized protein
MSLLIGSGEGVFRLDGSGSPRPIEGLEGRTIRVFCQSNGSLLAGADNGVFRSTDGGRSWQLSGAEGMIVWDLVTAPDNTHTVFAGTQPPHLFRSTDAGGSWRQVESMDHGPGHDKWCVPNSNAGARARTLVIDRTNPSRWYVGLEVGGVLQSDDNGANWSCELPGGNPDVHVMAAHPAQAGLIFATTGRGRFADDTSPVMERNAGLYGSKDGGRTWRYLWDGLEPHYTRPMCIDSRAPYALTVGCAPAAGSSFRDEGGAKSMVYQSIDGGETFRSLGDADHSPSAANILCVSVDPSAASHVLAGTDTGEVWRVSPDAKWTLLASGLPMVWSILPID